VIPTSEEELQEVVPVAVPVLAGMGGTLQDILILGGHVMDTWPKRLAMVADASRRMLSHPALLLRRSGVWGLAPG
jgi:hypothetical protein